MPHRNANTCFRPCVSRFIHNIRALKAPAQILITGDKLVINKPFSYYYCVPHCSNTMMSFSRIDKHLKILCCLRIIDDLIISICIHMCAQRSSILDHDPNIMLTTSHHHSHSSYVFDLCRKTSHQSNNKPPFFSKRTFIPIRNIALLAATCPPI